MARPEAKRFGVVWHPKSWQHVPWNAFFSLFCFMLCCGALALVLVQSDGKAIATWPSPSQVIPVSVMLSLIVGIANLCLAVALGSGYEISWWNQAIRGAEFRKLHFDLDIQRRTSAIFGRNVAIDRFAVAAAVSLIVSILDGPLIQRASTVYARNFGPYTIYPKIDVSNATLPYNFSSFTYGGQNPQLLTPLFSNVNRAYSNRDDIMLPVEGCTANTTCTFTIPAPGFDTRCTSKLLPYNFTELMSAADSDQVVDSSPQNNRITTFKATFKFDYSGIDAISMTILYKPDAANSGHVVQQECMLTLATVRYAATVKDGVAALKRWTFGQNDTIEIRQLSHSDLWFGGSVTPFVTAVGGVFFVLNSLYASQITLRLGMHTGAGFIFSNVTGQAASNYLTSDISTYGFSEMTWQDPTADIVNTARELMFRSAIAYSESIGVARNASARQQVEVQQTKILSAYESHYEYLAATIACMVLQAMIIAFLLLGWRHLGRDMSLDAFEIARALGAPLLQGGSSNSDFLTALSPLRHDRLRYGEILVPMSTTTNIGCGKQDGDLRIDDASVQPHEVAQLVEPEAGNYQEPNINFRSRLGLDREERVRAIRQGFLY